MSRISITIPLLAAALLSGCTTPPMGPTAVVMPAPGKPFEVFAQDQGMCKQFADSEVDGGATVSNLKQFGTVAINAAIGAGVGDAMRGRTGAEFGGALGAIGGMGAAANGAAHDQYSLQGRYNLAYTQCMYARGNQLATAMPSLTPSTRVAHVNYSGSGRGSPAMDRSGAAAPDAAIPGATLADQTAPSAAAYPPGSYPQARSMVR